MKKVEKFIQKAIYKNKRSTMEKLVLKLFNKGTYHERIRFKESQKVYPDYEARKIKEDTDINLKVCTVVLQFNNKKVEKITNKVLAASNGSGLLYTDYDRSRTKDFVKKTSGRHYNNGTGFSRLGNMSLDGKLSNIFDYCQIEYYNVSLNYSLISFNFINNKNTLDSYNGQVNSKEIDYYSEPKLSLKNGLPKVQLEYLNPEQVKKKRVSKFEEEIKLLIKDSLKRTYNINVDKYTPHLWTYDTEYTKKSHILGFFEVGQFDIFDNQAILMINSDDATNTHILFEDNKFPEYVYLEKLRGLFADAGKLFYTSLRKKYYTTSFDKFKKLLFKRYLSLNKLIKNFQELLDFNREVKYLKSSEKRYKSLVEAIELNSDFKPFFEPYFNYFDLVSIEQNNEELLKHIESLMSIKEKKLSIRANLITILIAFLSLLVATGSIIYAINPELSIFGFFTKNN